MIFFRQWYHEEPQQPFLWGHHFVSPALRHLVSKMRVPVTSFCDTRSETRHRVILCRRRPVYHRRPMENERRVSEPNGGIPLLSDGSLVEGKLITLENISVNTSALAGPRADNRVQSTSLKLSLQSTLNLSALLHTVFALLLYTL